ncbi:MAG: hypothetical protein HY899_06485 [Deltaproteobacteria bacterium]|nr:hypothetical protein [Deltaproteobacteria bacterium]
MTVVGDQRGFGPAGGKAATLPSAATLRRRLRQVVSFAWAFALLAAGCAGQPRGACDPEPPPGALGSICGFANPEDVEVVTTARLLLVSQMRRGAGGGSLAAIPLDTAAQPAAIPLRLWPTEDRGRDVAATPAIGDPSCTEPPSADRFAPHGIASAATKTPGIVRVAVVGHGEREAVELFDLAGAGDAATLSWRGCVPLPPAVVANDLSIAAESELVVSNYMPAMAGWRGLYYTLASGLGRSTGDVMEWRPGTGWRHLPGTVAPAPNGVLVSPDAAAVFYAETGSGLVRRVPRSGAPGDARALSVTIGGNPDNLSLGLHGKILVATHTDGASFLLCVLGRLPCRTGWSLFELDPVDLKAELLMHHDGAVVGAVASAAEFEGRVYFGAVFDDRIGVWQRGAWPIPAR